VDALPLIRLFLTRLGNPRGDRVLGELRLTFESAKTWDDPQWSTIERLGGLEIVEQYEVLSVWAESRVLPLRNIRLELVPLRYSSEHIDRVVR
jgi:hypothetical protein